MLGCPDADGADTYPDVSPGDAEDDDDVDHECPDTAPRALYGALSTTEATIPFSGSPNEVSWGAEQDLSGDGVDDLAVACCQTGGDYVRIFEGGGL